MGHQAWHRRGLLVILAVFAFAVIGGTLLSSFRWIQKPFPGFFLHENRTVGPYFLPHWSGGAAGLRSLDFIVSVDGSPVRDRADIYSRAQSVALGTHLHYGILRGSEALALSIPTMAFSFQDWLLSFGVYVFTGLAFFVIGVAPFCFRAASPAALPLCFMVLAVFVWFESTFDFVSDGLVPKEARIFAMILTPAAGVHLALLLGATRMRRSLRWGLLASIYVVAVVLGGLNSITFFGPVDRWIDVFRANYVFAAMGALAFLIILGSALAMSGSDLERSRLRVIFVGAVLGFLIPTGATVMTSVFQWQIPYNVAMISTVCFPLSVAYALLKYSLFDLGNTLKAGLTRLSLTLFLLVLYAGVVFLLGPAAGVYDQDPLTPLLFSVLVVLIFNPVLRVIEAVVDRYIYRQEYDPAQVHDEISLFLRSLTDAATLADGFLKQILPRLGIEDAVLVYGSQGAQNDVVASTKPFSVDFQGLLDHVQALWTPQNPGYRGISRAEALANPVFEGRRRDWRVVFETLDAELLVPIVFGHAVRGLVAFSAKKKGREYGGHDLTLLQTLTEQLALSLENGLRYEQSEKSKDEYRRLYDEAESAKRRLIEADRIKKDFVANVCHELRTPVSTLIGYGEVLLDCQLPEDSRQILKRMVANGQDLSELMDGLLDFSRSEADEAPNRFERVDLREILGSLQVMTQRLIRGRPIEFQVAIDSERETVQSDPRKLQQIMMQLLTNALKFTEKGRVEVRIRSIPGDIGALLEISVSDTGIGIAKKDQDLIFEGFRQLDGSSTRRYGGTGVGLSLCRKLAEALGGRISVESELGAGSVFSLLLPVTPPYRAMPAAGTAAAAMSL